MSDRSMLEEKDAASTPFPKKHSASTPPGAPRKKRRRLLGTNMNAAQTAEQAQQNNLRTPGFFSRFEWVSDDEAYDGGIDLTAMEADESATESLGAKSSLDDQSAIHHRR